MLYLVYPIEACKQLYVANYWANHTHQPWAASLACELRKSVPFSAAFRGPWWEHDMALKYFEAINKNSYPLVI